MKSKTINSIRLSDKEAQLLKDKAFDISMKKKELIKESTIIHYLLERTLKLVDVDKNGNICMHDIEDF